MEIDVKLRARLVLATVAVAVPMVIGLIWLDARSRHRAAEDALARITRSRLDEPGARARCEAAPASWGHGPGPRGPGARGPGPRGLSPDGDGPPHGPPPHGPPPPGPRGAPPRFYAYAADRTAADPAAPALPASVLTALQRQPWVAVAPSTFAAEVVVAVRTDWPDGPCAVIVTRGSTTPGFLGALLPASPIWLLPLAAVLAMLVLAIGPVVRRIRRLTAQVQAAAAAGFAGDASTAPAVDPAGDEVGELSRAFAAATGEVRRQLAARDDRERVLREFLANTTHDTMIPLTVLGQHLAALRDPAVRADPVQVEAKVASAMDEAHYLGALIHNLGVAARVDVAEPQVERSPVDLGALVARVLARHRPIASERGIELDSGVPEAPLRIDADLTMTEQAVSNLVYNGIRYNRRGGHVAVVVDRLAGDRFVLRVLDDGPGIAPDELGRLVERGFRGDAARGRSTGGHGLGLHITHTVARLHGFALAFDNRPEGGLEVTLTGPALPGEAGALG